MAPFTWESSTYNYCIYGSQTFSIFHECTSFKSKTSKMEYIIVSIWFCDHLPSRPPQGNPDVLSWQSYFAPKKEIPFLNQQRSTVLKPTNFQLKALAMSFCEDASYLKEVQEALQDNSFVNNIKKRYLSMKSMMNLMSLAIYLQEHKYIWKT